MKLSIKIGDAHPDLRDDLMARAARARAERIRLLATVGLLALRGGIGGTPNAASARAPAWSGSPPAVYPEQDSPVPVQAVAAADQRDDDRLNMTSVRVLAHLLNPDD